MHMSEVKCLGTNLADGWMAVAFDLGKGYGYETMIRVLDAIVEKYIIEVDRVWKAGVAGSGQEVIFKSGLFKKARPLRELEALREECGEIAVAGFAGSLGSIQLYFQMANQTSLLIFQVPEQSWTDIVQSALPAIAAFAASLL